MTRDEFRAAFLFDEELEYHVTGGETDPHKALPEPGWYPCTLYEIRPNGNVEMGLKTPRWPLGLEMTVMKKNIPIAFRKKDVSDD